MKKILSIVAASLLVFACSDKVQKYTIAGIISPENEGKEITLRIGNEDVASAVITNGAFDIEGSVAEPCAAKLVIESTTAGSMFVFLEKGIIEVNMVEGTIGGTALNDAYQAFDEKVSEIGKEYVSKVGELRMDANLSEEEQNTKMEEAYNQFIETHNTMVTDLFKENSENPLGALALASLSEDPELFNELYEQAGEKVKNDTGVQTIKAQLEKLNATAEGKMFTDFTIEKGNADGSSVSLSDYVGKGKWVLVDFWASWCSPCRKEIPNIADVYKQFKGDKFEVVGIAVWDKLDDTKKALEELPITWPVIFDAQSIPTDLYGINGIPQIILFGPDGTIVKRDLRGAAIGQKVAEVLAK